MALTLGLHALITSVSTRLREDTPPSDAELHRAAGRLSAQLRHAGQDRGPLLDVVDNLGPAEHILSSLAREHRKAHGRTPAVRVAEDVVRQSITLRVDARPMGQYMPEQYLRTQLWDVVRGIERARIALRWEQLQGESYCGQNPYLSSPGSQ